MALDKVTTTVELNIQLLSEDGQASRIIKVDNAAILPAATGRATIEAALEPAFAHVSSDTSSSTVSFFYDDTDYRIPMTRIGTIEWVHTERTVRVFE